MSLRKGFRPARMIALAFAAVLFSLSGAFAQGNPIKVGVGLSLTGGSASPGKMLLAALELWRDDVNAKGGMLGRTVELIHYDDQSTPANVPGIYTKLISVDKVDLLLGPYATNFVAPAMPTIMQHNKMTISLTAIGINRHFNYDKYFSMVPVGPEGVNSFCDRVLRIGVTAEAEAADGGDPGGRRRVRAQRLGRRPRRGQEARLQDHLRPELSAGHHRLHADGARRAGGQP